MYIFKLRRPDSQRGRYQETIPREPRTVLNRNNFQPKSRNTEPFRRNIIPTFQFTDGCKPPSKEQRQFYESDVSRVTLGSKPKLNTASITSSKCSYQTKNARIEKTSTTRNRFIRQEDGGSIQKGIVVGKRLPQRSALDTITHKEKIYTSGGTIKHIGSCTLNRRDPEDQIGAMFNAAAKPLDSNQPKFRHHSRSHHQINLRIGFFAKSKENVNGKKDSNEKLHSLKKSTNQVTNREYHCPCIDVDRINQKTEIIKGNDNLSTNPARDDIYVNQDMRPSLDVETQNNKPKQEKINSLEEKTTTTDQPQKSPTNGPTNRIEIVQKTINCRNDENRDSASAAENTIQSNRLEFIQFWPNQTDVEQTGSNFRHLEAKGPQFTLIQTCLEKRSNRCIKHEQSQRNFTSQLTQTDAQQEQKTDNTNVNISYAKEIILHEEIKKLQIQQSEMTRENKSKVLTVDFQTSTATIASTLIRSHTTFPNCVEEKVVTVQRIPQICPLCVLEGKIANNPNGELKTQVTPASSVIDSFSTDNTGSKSEEIDEQIYTSDKSRNSKESTEGKSGTEKKSNQSNSIHLSESVERKSIDPSERSQNDWEPPKASTTSTLKQKVYRPVNSEHVPKIYLSDAQYARTINDSFVLDGKYDSLNYKRIDSFLRSAKNLNKSIVLQQLRWVTYVSIC